jgi:hypothetical protein
MAASWLRYPREALAADYLRAGGGLAAGGLLAASGPGTLGILLSGALLLLFGAYGLRTFRQQRLRLRLSAQGVTIAGWRAASLPWDRLRVLSLRYYASGRQRRRGPARAGIKDWRERSNDSTELRSALGRGGFLQLLLKSEETTLKVESSLEGFTQLATAALAAARANGLLLDSVTTGNLAELGLASGGETYDEGRVD